MPDREAPPQPEASLWLPFRAPFDWRAMLGFLAPRAIPGVAIVAGESYLRTIVCGGRPGAIRVTLGDRGEALVASIQGAGGAVAPGIGERLRRLFDLDADPARIGADLGQDPLLAPMVAARPGLRVPGAWDGFELAVRAILGQQISVERATQLSGKLVRLAGTKLPPGTITPAPELTHLFPTPRQLAGATDLGLALGMPRARGAAIVALARAAAADPALFSPAVALDDAVTRLSRLPGIGGWTAQYIAMRALHLPDAFPHTDLGLLRAMQAADGVRPSPKDMLLRAEPWRPWRAYAALHLWSFGSSGRFR